MQESILEQGIDLMLYGMGTVIVFLTLLVIATTLMSRLVLRFFPEPVKPLKRPPAPSRGIHDPHLIAIIQAAVTQHRSRR